jgi:hypothetical protein
MTTIMPPPTNLLKKLLREFLNKIIVKTIWLFTAEIMVNNEAGAMNTIVVCGEC